MCISSSDHARIDSFFLLLKGKLSLSNGGITAKPAVYRSTVIEITYDGKQIRKGNTVNDDDEVYRYY